MGKCAIEEYRDLLQRQGKITRRISFLRNILHNPVATHLSSDDEEGKDEENSPAKSEASRAESEDSGKDEDK